MGAAERRLGEPRARGDAGLPPTRLEPGNDVRGDGRARIALDLPQRAAVVVIRQRHGDPGLTRASGAADAMDVALGFARQVEVDHVADAGDVDAARRDIRGDQRAHAAAAHVLQRARSLALVHVAMQRRGRVPLPLQPRRQRLGIPLGGDEDDALPHRGVGEQVVEQAMLVRVIVGEVNALLDRERRGLFRLDVDPRRIAQQARGKPRDRGVERGREQHRLPRLRRHRRNAIDVVDEAHVEHAVGLVDDQHVDPGKIDAAALDVIHQPPGGGDEDVDAALELAVLHGIRRTAVDAHGPCAQELAVAHDLVGDLLREFARRGEHQHARHADAAARRYRMQAQARRAGAAPAARTPPSCRCRSAPSRSGRVRRAAPESSAPGSASVPRSRRRRAPAAIAVRDSVLRSACSYPFRSQGTRARSWGRECRGQWTGRASHSFGNAAACAQNSGTAGASATTPPAATTDRRQAGRTRHAQAAATGSTDCKAIVANRMLPLRLEPRGV